MADSTTDDASFSTPTGIELVPFLVEPVEVSQIVVPLDGSPFAERALPVAAWVAAGVGADVHLVEVVPGDSDEDAEGAIRYLDSVAHRRGGAAWDIVRRNDVGAALADALASAPGRMACLATHGRDRSAALLGSVAASLLERSSRPSVLVGPLANPITASDAPVVVAVDGTTPDETLVSVALGWAARLGRRLEIVTVAEPTPSGWRPGVAPRRARGPAAPEAYIASLVARAEGSCVTVGSRVSTTRSACETRWSRCSSGPPRSWWWDPGTAGACPKWCSAATRSASCTTRRCRRLPSPWRGVADDTGPHVVDLVEETPWRWRIVPVGTMRVPGIVFASRELLPDVAGDRSLEQVVNVAGLPGIVGASYAMPDVHWGYGFPIGGVAATDVEAGGVVSPGGVGFDISCGVRLLRAPLDRAELAPRRDALMDELGRLVPKGMGRGAVWEIGSEGELRRVLARGAVEAVERGFGDEQDLARCEDRGALDGADPAAVSERALARGLHQVGSLGSGNHFLEVQAVDQVIDVATATALGLRPGQVCVMIHSGSRGLGHQVCTDHVRRMEQAMASYGIQVADRQLACVPVRSPEGEAYLAAMAAAANYGRANRQLLAVAARRAFASAVGTDRLELVYDVSHNLAKLERHEVGGRSRLLCVHRKGATRALPPGHPDLPAALAAVGQPVLVPGSMGTASHLLVGVPGGGAFHSTCHGAGRTMSRTAARKRISGAALQRELEAAGIAVRAGSRRGLAEEAPFSYKDVDAVVATVEQAGLARRVARLVPLGVVKG